VAPPLPARAALWRLKPAPDLPASRPSSPFSPDFDCVRRGVDMVMMRVEWFVVGVS